MDSPFESSGHGSSHPQDRFALIRAGFPHPLRAYPVRLLEALSRTGTRNQLVESLLDAQDGPGTVQRGFDEMIDQDER